MERSLVFIPPLASQAVGNAAGGKYRIIGSHVRKDEAVARGAVSLLFAESTGSRGCQRKAAGTERVASCSMHFNAAARNNPRIYQAIGLRLPARDGAQLLFGQGSVPKHDCCPLLGFELAASAGLNPGAADIIFLKTRIAAQPRFSRGPLDFLRNGNPKAYAENPGIEHEYFLAALKRLEAYGIAGQVARIEEPARGAKGSRRVQRRYRSGSRPCARNGLASRRFQYDQA